MRLSGHELQLYTVVRWLTDESHALDNIHYSTGPLVARIHRPCGRSRDPPPSCNRRDCIGCATDTRPNTVTKVSSYLFEGIPACFQKHSKRCLNRLTHKIKPEKLTEVYALYTIPSTRADCRNSNSLNAALAELYRRHLPHRDRLDWTAPSLVKLLG